MKKKLQKCPAIWNTALIFIFLDQQFMVQPLNSWNTKILSKRKENTKRFPTVSQLA